MAWDDPAASTSSANTEPKLVNNLDLLLKGPDGLYYLPWSIEQPYVPTDETDPELVEPEPITASDIKPARRDRPNNRDNLEQVLVENPEPGTWRVFVLPGALTLPPQDYSLVLPQEADPSVLHGGKLAFLSDRTGAPHVFVKDLDAGTPPRQITSDGWPWRPGAPQISPDGKYIAFILRDYRAEPDHEDILLIMTGARSIRTVIRSPALGYQYARYPSWSPGSDQLLLTVFDTWGDRGLLTVDVNSGGQASASTANLVIPLSVAPDAPDVTAGVYSKDGRYMFFRADNQDYAAGLFRARVDGTAIERIWGNNEPIRLAYSPSVSPDDRFVIFNSEMRQEDPEQYLDDELLRVGVHSGVVEQLTRAPGSEYGSYAWGGSGEHVMQSSPSLGENNDLFLVYEDARVKADIADPDNAYNDWAACWTKP